MQRLPEITDAPSFWSRLQEATGHTVFDVGANIGQAAKVLAEHFNHVYSFEPCVESLAILMVEAPLNVVVVPLAVSASGGSVVLDETAESIRTGQLTSGSRLGWGEKIGERNVESITLDQAVDRWGTPDLVKVDTEGHEVKVLEGARRLIAAKKASWLIEVHDRSHEKRLKEMLVAYRLAHIDHDFLRGQDEAADHFYLEAVPT